MRPIKLAYIEIHNGQSSPYIEICSSSSDEEGKSRIIRQSMQDFDRSKLKSTKKKKFDFNEDALLRIHKQYQGIKEGYLEKQKNGMIKIYEKKFFYFNDEKKMKFKGVINFKLAKSSIIKYKVKHFKILMGNSTSFSFRSDSQDDIDEWVELLKCVIDENKVYSLQIIQTSNPKKYLEFDSVTEQEFIDCAETGDILLFETNNATSKIQRALTRSKYDHVGMVIRFNNKLIQVFDASQDNGVSLKEWNQYIRENDLFERFFENNIFFFKRVVLRKLNYQNKQELEPIILNFVDFHLGDKYHLNAQKLFKFNSINEPTNHGFFCSELVAKVLKECQLLDPQKSSAQYWPVDFSEAKNLNFINDATLSNEISIILNQDIVEK